MEKMNSNCKPQSYRDALSKVHSGPSPSAIDAPLTLEQEDALRLSFPTRVQLSREKVADATAFWTNAVIAKPLGRDVAPAKLEASLTSQWSTLGEWELFPMAYGLFLCRFASPESRDAVLMGGPWVVDGAALAMSPFDPAFRPHPSHVTKATMWVRLPDLPPAVWSAALICDILSVVGRVVRLDDDTEHRRRGRFARAAVEVDLTRPLPPGVAVDIEGGSPPSFWQRFRYEHLHCFCLRCRRVGHRAVACTEPLSSSPIVDEGLLVRHHRFSRPTKPTPVRHPRPRPSTSPRGDDPRSPVRVGESPRAAALVCHASPRASPAAEGPTPVVAADVINRDVTAPVGASASPSAVPHGPRSGPVGLSGHSSPHILFPSADGPKHDEPESSRTTSAVQQEQVLERVVDGVQTVGEVTERERRLIQQIMEEDLDSNSDFIDEADWIEDDILFTTVGKKKKHKGKFPAICLRPAPRDRAPMKRTKVAPSTSASKFKFSLLSDILGDLSPDTISARHGPPTG